MQPYERSLKARSRRLRIDMSAAELRLWQLLRRKRLLGVQVYRQKPLLGYIVDFHAPAVGLVIEVDGAQYLSDAGATADARRTTALESVGLKVLRFDNLQVLTQIKVVMEAIYTAMAERLSQAGPIPPASLFKREERQKPGQKRKTASNETASSTRHGMKRGVRTRTLKPHIRSPPLKKGG